MRNVIAESGDDGYGSLLSLSSKFQGEQKHTRNVLYFGRHGGCFEVGACDAGGRSFHIEGIPSTQVSLAMETNGELAEERDRARERERERERESERDRERERER